jgi:hypothetical protein
MSEEKAKAGEKSEETTPPTGLGLLFFAAALALALVLSFVGLLAYMALSPRPAVTPPTPAAPAKPAPQGNLHGDAMRLDRRT